VDFFGPSQILVKLGQARIKSGQTQFLMYNFQVGFWVKKIDHPCPARFLFRAANFCPEPGPHIGWVRSDRFFSGESGWVYRVERPMIRYDPIYNSELGFQGGLDPHL
jgi:hypothetical protein